MKYEVRFTTQFKKDLKLAKKQGKDTEKLFAVIEKLANGEPLEEKYRDHDLSGNYKGCRECHIEPDWLLLYEVRFTTQFKKDLKLAKKQGKDTEKLFAVIEKLANGEPLEEKYCDHDLSGNYKGCRECHIEPDWLLVYEVIDNVLVLMLYRVGSHSDLFR